MMADLARIKRNVSKMVGMNAPEAEIDAYIAGEGVTVDEVRNFQLEAQPAAEMRPGSSEYAQWAAEQARAGKALPQVSGDLSTPNSLIDKVNAATTAAFDAIPIAGPSIKAGMQDAKAGLWGVPREAIVSEDAARENANPISRTVGAVTGTVAPFMAGGAIPGVARVLGMAGGLPSRVGFGLLSGGGIGALDAAARGGDPTDMVNAGGIGAALGGAIPVGGRLAKMGLDRMLGKSLPKSAANLGRALRDDKIPAREINQRLSALGPDAMVMDLGPNLQRQAGAVASVPGKGQTAIREAVAARAGGASNRVAADVAATLGSGPELSAMREQIISAQSAAAKPLYDAIRDVKLPVQQGNFAFVFQTPLGKQALARARQMAANDGYRGTDTLGIIDYAKRALDDIAGEAIRKNSRNAARQASQLAKILTTEADKMVPGYKAARDAFAGPAQIIDAMDAGAAVFSKDMSPGQLQSALSGMTASEKDAFIQAARSAVEAQMGNAVNDAAALRNLFKKGYNEQKLRTLLGDDVADDLMRRINREAVFGQTSNVVTGNSETAARQAAQAEVAPELARAPRPEGLVGLVLSAFDKARNSLSGVRQPKINAQMAGVHTANTVPQSMLEQLSRAGQKPPNALLGPASGGLLLGRTQPVEVTVRGGR